MSEVVAVVCGAQAASAPDWQKPYPVWSSRRALSVLLGIVYITVDTYICLLLE